MRHEPFGSSQLEFAEPSWYRGLPTPYYSERHAAWRTKVRQWVDEHLTPHVSRWEAQGAIDNVPALAKKCYEAGIYASAYDCREFGATPPPGADAFTRLITTDELARCGSGGVTAGFLAGVQIGVGPILIAGSAEQKRRFVKPVLQADKFICLAVTEPTAGSDVSAVRTTARREGNHFIVNGAKKFITGAHYAHFFTTVVQTEKGLSILVIEKGPGVQVRRMSTQGWAPSQTGYITFEDVRVPVENLVGAEGAGFIPIMYNFNSERFGMSVQCIRYSRLLLESAFSYASMRKTFGRPLWSSQVIRAKVGEMARRIETTWAWTESLAFSMQSGVEPALIGGQVALLKVAATETFEFCAKEASQVFGGASFLKSGPGELVERLYREVRVNAIGGGSAEILTDFAMRRLKSKM